MIAFNFTYFPAENDEKEVIIISGFLVWFVEFEEWWQAAGFAFFFPSIT